MVLKYISDKTVFISIADPNDVDRNCNCGGMGYTSGII